MRTSTLLLVALALVASASLASAAVDLKNVQYGDFMSWTHKHGKTYDSHEEMAVRFGNFMAAAERAVKLNEAHVAAGGEAIYGLTKFSDLSQEEFESQYLNFVPNPAREVVNAPVHAGGLAVMADPPASFDWRDHGAVTPVKDQGQCGSCWAFSATEEIESMNFLYGTKILSVLAPEQIVDCDKTDGGCNGGDTISAYEYVISAGGQMLEADYPYTAGDSGSGGHCKFSKSKVHASVSNYTYATPPCSGTCSKQDENLMMANMYSTGPVSICVDASTWNSYSGGIVTANCHHAYSALDHCVQAVGYNTDSQGNQYWLVRNSWNTDWGEEGLIYIKVGSNLCGIADEATFSWP